MVVALREIRFGSADYAASRRLREAVLRQPLGLVLSAADLEGEAEQIHVAAFEDDSLVGSVTLKPLDRRTVKLRQMAVDPALQGGGVGRQLVRFAEDLAAARGFGRVELQARTIARGFYERLGYRAGGPEFLELTVPHVEMSRDL